MKFCLPLLTWLLLAFAGPTTAQLTASQPVRAVASRWVCPPCGGDCDQPTYAGPGTCPHCGMALVPAASAATAAPAEPRQNVAILVFDGMEVLDFAGPGEVFTVTPGFNVYTVARTSAPVLSQGFVSITPAYTLANCPPPDIVVLPGGNLGSLLDQPDVISWVQSCAGRAERLLSVCTGAGLLGKAGLLDGKQATTYHGYLDALQQATPKARILRDTRFVDNGQIVTTAGISAGIDGALHVVASLKGEAVAQQTAQSMEYDKWQPNQGLVVKASRAAQPSTHSTKKSVPLRP